MREVERERGREREREGERARGREGEREREGERVRGREKGGMPCNKHFSSGFCAEKPTECIFILQLL